ncbi:DUF1634 domain-containing protein [Fructilactobacillus carniphilus]|uniref:DUF1634 domain-containing protein n=1 Tax=Fructilactobacillus carniphilus TaxID=2940297 RepID=A0ABY5BYN2_9LACO|nr:DUF1634 domain-containing protein [Fructilactobacillus carniphilus]USS90733.1 DUF1634 domain-containing protein [Fructilactobacillus carniphilus]
MKTSKPATNEIQAVEQTIGKILRWGVIVAATIMILGLLLYLMNGSLGVATHYHVKNFSELLQGLLTGKPYAVMMTGIFALILTPVLRVVVSIYSFYREHDSLYVVITSLVLIILMASFWLGIEFHL